MEGFAAMRAKEARHNETLRSKEIELKSTEAYKGRVGQGFWVFSVLGYLISGIQYFMRKFGYKVSTHN